MLDFQFSPAQFSQAEQVLSRLVTVDGSQADQPVAMAQNDWTFKVATPRSTLPHLAAVQGPGCRALRTAELTQRTKPASAPQPWVQSE
ncbi:hypothetical protein V8C86DRAFT_3113954 [Haematococcus lacustris]